MAKESENRFLNSLGIVTFNPLSEMPPKILSSQTIETTDDNTIKDAVDSLHVALQALVSHYSPQERAIGLAAPQLGIPYRIAAVNEVDGTRRTLVNPRVVEESDTTEPWRLGCLSLGSYRQISQYPREVTIQYDDEQGLEREWNLTGDDVVVPLHELEHLDGRLLTDRVQDQSTQLFIPREELFGERALVKNWAAMIALRQACKLPVHVQSTEEYYSRLFRGESVDWTAYIESHVAKRQELVDTLLQEIPANGSVFEAGCGTSALSVYLNKQGYDVTCIDYSPEMLTLAKRCNKAANGTVKYEIGDLFRTGKQADEFDVVFSHGVLEEVGGPEKVVQAINESLRIGKKFIFSVPTIWDRSNNLNGNENLWTVQKWQKIIADSAGTLAYTTGSFPFNPRLARMNTLLNGGLTNISANVIFCIERTQ